MDIIVSQDDEIKGYLLAAIIKGRLLLLTSKESRGSFILDEVIAH